MKSKVKKFEKRATVLISVYDIGEDNLSVPMIILVGILTRKPMNESYAIQRVFLFTQSLSL